MSVRENFANSIPFSVMINYNKGAVVQISAVFRTVYNVACQTVF